MTEGGGSYHARGYGAAGYRGLGLGESRGGAEALRGDSAGGFGAAPARSERAAEGVGEGGGAGGSAEPGRDRNRIMQEPGTPAVPAARRALHAFFLLFFSLFFPPSFPPPLLSLPAGAPGL